ncbi:MAG: UDP-N-acetylmuramoyl-L-alanyl-D-glutamate--2,6-diaminopimelate ligase [Verrucomicrobiota bacterium]
MKLTDLLESVHVISLSGSAEVEVSGIVYDSRKVVEGSVFCAHQGQGSDGHAYIQDAIDGGAVAIVSERPNPAEFLATWVQVSKSRAAMGKMAAVFEQHPSLEFPVVGITGTNGKTTTAFLVHHLMTAIWHRAGLLGTIHYSTGGDLEDASHTTPESVELHQLLRKMRDHGCRGAVMEVSSHGLAQSRVAGVAFDVGVFTNLTQDHLDFHRTMESYFEAKRLLFEQMSDDSQKKSVAVINIDDPYGERLVKSGIPNVDQLTFGRSVGADFQASDLRSDFNGTQFKLSFRERSFLVKIPLIGSYNVNNAVAAIAAAYAIGLNLREVVAKMADAPQIPGRLELVGNRQTNYRVFVDYAHTPDALENVLKTLKDLEPARIITVFGCGGDRDSAKRPEMARAAERYSDLAILTSDNPRTEDPVQIINDAKAGFLGRDYEVIEDRGAAIKRAIDEAGGRDIVVIAGKGHEDYQEVDGVRHPFDDRKEAAKHINSKAERGAG